MTTTYVRHGSLSVAAELDAFVRDEAAPGTGVTPDAFWAGVEGLLADYAPKNRALCWRAATNCRRNWTTGIAVTRGSPTLRSSGLPAGDRLHRARSGPTSAPRPPTSIPRSPAWPGRSWSCP